jgi:PAS domain S-box-containing protein
MVLSAPTAQPRPNRGALTATAAGGERRETIKIGALQDAIFNSANFSSIATDEKGVIQIFNVGAERMLGYAAADVVNQITPADISDPQELVTRAATLSLELDTPILPGFEALVFKASRGIEDIYELTYIRQDGSRFPAIVSVTALRDAQDSIIGYLLIGTDNTVRKQVEAAQELLDQRLRDQQFYTRSLIESNIDALMMTDPQGIISDVNQQMIELTGRSRDELIGAPCKTFFTDPSRADAAIKRVLAENHVTNYELTVRDVRGKETVVSYNAATFHDRDRKLQGVIAAARDVTERKQFERTLLETNIELEHASKMKSEFLATMSHELRTPLNAIIGFSEALKDGLVGQMSQSQLEYTGDIFTSGQHLLSLINDILDLSKVEAGMMALELEGVDLNLLLTSSLLIVREKAAEHGISLDLDVDVNLGVAELDLRKTKQIVYNMLSNAVKFGGDGGQVTLSARRVLRNVVGTMAGTWPTHNFSLADSDCAVFLEICVVDNGIGISTSNMGSLFQAFSQIDSSLARQFQGTGLGLAMVKQLTELQGGAVAVSSAEGLGSRFAVWLPLDLPTGQLTPVSVEAPLAQPVLPAPRTALIVEKDNAAAELVSALLEGEGFDVIRADSVDHALTLATQQPLSLITLDVDLPTTGGWELLNRMRADADLAHVPAVIITSRGEGNVALRGGSAAILQKPVNRALLRASLANLGLDEIRGPTRTVLVVDDDPKAVEVIARMLPTPAYAVVRAYGGKEAIALAQQVLPDLILLDLMMPEVNGFEVVKVLHATPATAKIPILVVTAKHVTIADRAVLAGDSDNLVNIVEKAGFNRSGFMSEVWRALGAPEEGATHGTSTGR